MFDYIHSYSSETIRNISVSSQGCEWLQDVFTVLDDTIDPYETITLHSLDDVIQGIRSRLNYIDKEPLSADMLDFGNSIINICQFASNSGIKYVYFTIYGWN